MTVVSQKDQFVVEVETVRNHHLNMVTVVVVEQGVQTYHLQLMIEVDQTYQ